MTAAFLATTASGMKCALLPVPMLQRLGHTRCGHVLDQNVGIVSHEQGTDEEQCHDNVGDELGDAIEKFSEDSFSRHQNFQFLQFLFVLSEDYLIKARRTDGPDIDSVIKLAESL